MKPSKSPKNEIDVFSVSSNESDEETSLKLTLPSEILRCSESSELFIDFDENTTPIFEKSYNDNLDSPTTVITKWEILKQLYELKEPEPLESIKEEDEASEEELVPVEEIVQEKKTLDNNSFISSIWNCFSKKTRSKK